MIPVVDVQKLCDDENTKEFPKKCGICKAEKKAETYTEDVNNSVAVIRNVPATVCTECGNVWYTGTVAARLEKIVDRCVKAVVTDVAVVNYAEKAA